MVEAAVASVAGIPDGEVILVANGPAEGRRPLDVRSPNLRVIECPAPTPSAARNLGRREARNEIVLFTDDDCVIAPEWVERLTRRLRDGASAVATPLEVRRDGPVTTFLDYQRIFHPRPIDADTVQNGVGASIGIRRDLVPVQFDEDMSAGDDMLFGARLRDAGISMANAADAPPPLHLVPERLQSLTRRFHRYGSSNANVFLRKGQPQLSIPHATSLYSSLCRNEIATPRRFEEFADPNLRELFASLERIRLGAALVGYLAEAGRALDREIIRVDREALDAGWIEIAQRLEEDFPWDGDWRRLPLDFGRWLTPRQTRAPALAPDIGEILRRSAPLTQEAGPDPDLDKGGELIARRAEEVWAGVNEIWGDVREGRLPAQEDAVARRMREAGIAFSDGLQTMEAIALGPVEPAARGERASRTRSRG